MSLNCEICSKLFTFKQAYDRHVLTHDLEKIATFNQSFYMAHPNSEPAMKPVYDPGEKFDDHDVDIKPTVVDPPHKVPPHKLPPHKLELERQAAAENSITSESSTVPTALYRAPKLLKIHTCETCSKTYSRKDHLTRHKLYHTGDRPHVCSVCFKSFVRKDKLQRHERTHIKDVEFHCSVCNKGFMRKDGLKKHMRIHPEVIDIDAAVNVRPNEMMSL